MKRVLYFFLCCCIGFTSVIAEPFYDHNVYGGLLYNIVREWARAHADAQPEDVRDFLYTKSCNLIFDEAKKSGYTRRDVIYRAKWVALRQEPIVELVVAGLEIDMRNYVMHADVYWLALVVATSFSTVVSLGALGFAIFYFKKDRRVMLRY